MVVFHRGPPSEDLDSLINSLAPSSDSTVGLMIKMVDLDNEPESGAIKMWQSLETDVLPWMVMAYPFTSRINGPAWSGELNAENVEKLMESPIRRALARGLLQGESGVWILLESGNSEKDDKAAAVLTENLKHMEESLVLPDISPQDISSGLMSIEADELKVSFSLLRVSKENPEEAVLVNMLLGTEEDLKDLKEEPIAFPVFGRGRALYALVGKGINRANILDACGFLVGSCSCEVKDQNPGVDLFMNVDWVNLVQPYIDLDRELPALTGFTASLAETGKAISGGGNSVDSAEEEDPVKSVPGNVQITSPEMEEVLTKNSPFLRKILLIGAASLIGVFGLGFFVFRVKG